MKLVTVSSKFQVVIPREVREAMGIRPGARMQVLQYENRIELIPCRILNRCGDSLKASRPTCPGKRIDVKPGGFLRLAGVFCG